jgi:glutamate racemase
VVERFAKDVIIYQNTCPGLVQEIEAGNLTGSTPYKILNDALIPMLNEGIDTVVLGCTHYPFVIPIIQAITGEKVRIIDPAPAVAKQTLKIALNLETQPNLISSPEVTLITSGDFDKFKQTIISLKIPYARLLFAKWKEQNRRLNITQPSNQDFKV